MPTSSRHNRRLAAVVLTLAVLCASGRIAGQPAKLSSSWKQIRTPELTVAGNARESELRRILRELTTFRGALSKLFPGMRMTSPVPTTVVVFKDDDGFSRYKPRDSRGKPVQNVGGYLTLQPEANLIVFGFAEADAFRVTFHEYAHYVIHRNVRTPLPSWVDEGLAEFYSTFVADYRGHSILGSAPAHHVRTLRQFTFIPLRQLVSPRESEAMWQSQNQIAMFYAESWALVHYVMVGRRNGAPSPLNIYLQALARTPSQDAAFREAFGVDVAGMERELKAYMYRITLPALQLSAEAEPAATLPAEPMREADVQHIEGALLADMGATEPAEQLLGAALALDPMHTGALVSLARVRLDQDRPADAIASLRDLTRDSPTDIGALYYLGRALFDEWRFDEALATFDRASRLSPEHAHSWAGLSAAALALNRDAQANATLGLALQLESDPEFYLRHAEAAMRLGRNDAAATAARNFIHRRGFGEEAAQYASFVAAIASWRSGDAPGAEAILKEAQAAVPANSWVASVLQFLLGSLTSDRLLSMAGNIAQRTEAHTYIAFKLDGAGRQAEALTHFRWVLDQGARNGVEYAMTRNEMARLRHVGQ